MRALVFTETSIVIGVALLLGPLLPVHGIGKYQRCTCGNPKCPHPGKHPVGCPNGCYDAHRDERRLERELQRGHNIALHCTDVLVLDLDTRSNGQASLEAYESEHGRLPETPRAFTGGGGWHYFFKLPEGIKDWRKKIGEGLDIKAGEGAYVVVAPSLHLSGRRYSWDDSPEHTELADAPEWLLRRAIKFDAPAPSLSTGTAAQSLIGRAFHNAGMVLRSVDADRLAVRCPWEHVHTSRKGGSSTSTIVYGPTEKKQHGIFFCAHAHCATRTAEQALGALPHECVTKALRELLADRAAREPAESEPDLDYEMAEREAIQGEASL